MPAKGTSPIQNKAGIQKRFSILFDMAEGETAIIVELMELFQEQTPELMDTLKEAVTSGDWHAIQITSHTLKPTFQYLEMERAYQIADELELCREIDEHCRSRVHQLLNVLIAEVQRGLTDVIEAVRILQLDD